MCALSPAGKKKRNSRTALRAVTEEAISIVLSKWEFFPKTSKWNKGCAAHGPAPLCYSNVRLGVKAGIVGFKTLKLMYSAW